MTTQPHLVGISGVAGGGKTTLTKALASHFPHSTTLFHDDYANEHTYPTNIQQWIAAGADFNQFRLPQFSADLATLKSGQPITSIVDGSRVEPTQYIFCEAPLGRAHHATGQHFDTLIYIKTPLEIGLARFILRYTARKETIPAAMIEEFLQIYLNAYRPLYLEQIKQVLPDSELVLDGENSVESWVKAVEERLSQ